ncbi:MAG: hypothetical protein SGPRY_000590, partial [Prymnesium sp.]
MAGSSLEERESLSSERYLRICRRLAVLPEPLLLRTLRSPLTHAGAYSTRQSESLTRTPEAVRAMVSALEYAKGIHTVKLVGLRQGELPLLTKEVMVSLVRAVLSTPLLSLLDLSDNAIDDATAGYQLQCLISRSPSLVSLVLAHNNLGESSGRGMLAALEASKSMRCLDLSCNPALSEWRTIGKHVGKMLSMNHSLVGFSCSLSSACAIELLMVLLPIPRRCVDS